MDTKLTLTIIGSVLSLIGVIFIAIPKVVNEKTMNSYLSITDLQNDVKENVDICKNTLKFIEIGPNICKSSPKIV